VTLVGFERMSCLASRGSATAAITQSVLVAVVYVSEMVPNVVAILKLAPPKVVVAALLMRVVRLEVASDDAPLPPPPEAGLKLAIAAA
jgi:hypothetical protein